MNKKSFYNPIIAASYITLVVFSINWISNIPNPPEENIFMPIAMLALLVFSVALMGFLFFYQPLLLIIGGKHAEASKHFLDTLIVFVALTVIFIAMALNELLFAIISP